MTIFFSSACHFSGYTTAWQAVSVACRWLHWKANFMRQRLAAGLLRKIGMTDTIATLRRLRGDCFPVGR